MLVTAWSIQPAPAVHQRRAASLLMLPTKAGMLPHAAAGVRPVIPVVRHAHRRVVAVRRSECRFQLDEPPAGKVIGTVVTVALVRTRTDVPNVHAAVPGPPAPEAE